MAQVSFMDGIMSIRGKLGDTIYRTTPSGKTIAYQQRHSRRTPPTEKELLQRKRFAIATRIARSAMYVLNWKPSCNGGSNPFLSMTVLRRSADLS